MASAEWTTARERSCAALRRRWPTDRAPVTAAGRLRAHGEPFRPSHLLSNLIPSVPAKRHSRRASRCASPAEPTLDHLVFAATPTARGTLARLPAGPPHARHRPVNRA